MRKSSTVTVRETPVTEPTTTVARAVTVHGETFAIETTQRVEVIDLTDRVMAVVRRIHLREGIVSLWSLHTTCGLFINESQAALASDITRFLEQLVPREAAWRHNDPAHSDCDRMNADSHLRALVLGHSMALQVTGGELVLGHWQRILMAELDGPRERTFRVQVWGVE